MITPIWSSPRYSLFLCHCYHSLLETPYLRNSHWIPYGTVFLLYSDMVSSLCIQSQTSSAIPWINLWKSQWIAEYTAPSRWACISDEIRCSYIRRVSYIHTWLCAILRWRISSSQRLDCPTVNHSWYVDDFLPLLHLLRGSKVVDFRISPYRFERTAR